MPPQNVLNEISLHAIKMSMHASAHLHTQTSVSFKTKKNSIDERGRTDQGNARRRCQVWAVTIDAIAPSAPPPQPAHSLLRKHLSMEMWKFDPLRSSTDWEGGASLTTAEASKILQDSGKELDLVEFLMFCYEKRTNFMVHPGVS